MRILFLGDIFGRSGRETLVAAIPQLKEKFTPDAIIANCENAAHGFGILPQMADRLFESGIDVLTSGNHIWDQKQIINYIDQEPRLLRPLNDSVFAKGQGYVIHTTGHGQRLKVVNVMGRVGLDPHLDPLLVLEQNLASQPPVDQGLDAIIVDVHAESTAEKQTIAYYFDGKVTAVVGTHTHVPTADTRILPQGTGFQSDLGMCGDYQSVIGMAVSHSFARLQRLPGRSRLEPATGIASLCGLLIETNPKTGLAQTLTRISYGGVLDRDDVTVRIG